MPSVLSTAPSVATETASNVPVGTPGAIDDDDVKLAWKRHKSVSKWFELGRMLRRSRSSALEIIYTQDRRRPHRRWSLNKVVSLRLVWAMGYGECFFFSLVHRGVPVFQTNAFWIMKFVLRSSKSQA